MHKIEASTQNRIFLFDIDNTLADTWPSLQVNYSNEIDRYASLAVFMNMRKLILQLKQQGNPVFFISHRPFNYYYSTIKWLKSIGINPSFKDVLLVNSPGQKVQLINKLLKSSKEVIFIDDLSFNHEKGEVEFYKNEIEFLKKISVAYYDAAFIDNFNNSEYRFPF
ncbi:MAG: hypothetical protein H0X62_06390 [Bacteroidetes bacterium]|nr:hypothetical protein [Bacteroidota bacterium]